MHFFSRRPKISSIHSLTQWLPVLRHSAPRSDGGAMIELRGRGSQVAAFYQIPRTDADKRETRAAAEAAGCLQHRQLTQNRSVSLNYPLPSDRLLSGIISLIYLYFIVILFSHTIIYSCYYY